MIDDKTVLGVILARGGSKGLLRKNVRNLAGKPLIAWTIEAGHESEYLDRLILSSDDDEIMAVAREYGCEIPFRRPAELARDDSTSMDALLHALDQLPEHDYTVLLQPTSPLRIAADIDGAIERCHTSNAPACVSVTRTDKPPQWMYTVNDAHHLQPVLDETERIPRRQDAPPTYALNGAVYVGETEALRNRETFLQPETVAYPMPEAQSIDIDTEFDLIFTEVFIQHKQKRTSCRN